MAAKMTRKTKRQLTMQDQQRSRIENGMRKRKERGRRDAWMRDAVKRGQLPYTPPVLSWLSEQLGKPGRLITQADVDTFLKG
jgi:hypothetical protein